VKIILFANTAWYLYNYRLPLAVALRDQGHDVTLVSPRDDYVSRLEAEGFRWVEFNLARRGMNPFSELAAVLRLIRLYRREKPDIVHHFTIKCVLYGSLAAMAVCVRRRINAITGLGFIFVANDVESTLLRFPVKWLYRFALRGSQVVFQNKEDLQIFIDGRLVDTRQVSLIRGSGVDMKRFSLLPFPEGLPLVVCAGRLIWDKGVGEFVEAARELRKRGVEVKMVLVGEPDDGNPTSIQKNTLEAWQRSKQVELWGWREDMLEVFRQAWVVCLPSYREGLPKGLLEASACGRPIVAADVPGCRDVVQHGKTGYLFPVRNPIALANTLESLVNDSDLCRRMGKDGREFVGREFSLEKIISQTIAIYEKLGRSVD